MEKERVRESANGQWRSMFLSAGFAESHLTKKHGPCPLCGGKDRFRMYDDWEETGGCHCNQCNDGCADGFATIQWFLGIDFNAAVNKVGELLGLNGKPKKKQKSDRPEDQFTRCEWNDNLVRMFKNKNQGVLEEALEQSRAFMASHSNTTVLVFPIIGIDMKTECGYVVMNTIGKYLTRFTKDDKKIQVRHKQVKGSKSGFIGFVPETLEGRIVVKCEGCSDMLAVLSGSPEAVVLSNASGTHEHPKWMAEQLAKADQVWILHDADEPGQEGAARWCHEIAQLGGRVKNIKLPYPVDKTKGMDARDLIIDRGHDGFWRWLSDTASKTEFVDPDSIELPKTSHDHKEILEKLMISVVCEDDDGQIEIYSPFLQKTSVLRSLNRIAKQNMLQVAGTPAMVIGEDGGMSMKSVINAIAIEASDKRRGNKDHQGIGVYRTGENRIVLSNGSHLSYLNGGFETLMTPRCDDLIFDFRGRRAWYIHDDVAASIEQAKDKKWCHDSVQELTSIIDRWTWRIQDISPVILAGLVLATFVQSVWKWRPAVAIRGASNCGKSVFAKFLFGDAHGLGVFGRLAHYMAQSTEAGLRQSVSRDSVAIAIDEWDSTPARVRADILGLIRTSGGGEEQWFGSASQKARRYSLRHIPWLIGIHVALDSNADANRFLTFDMESAPPARSDAWVEPSQEERDRLFYSLLGIAIVHGLRAAERASELHRRHANKEIDNRLVSNLSVPVAMLSCAADIDPDELFVKCLRSIEEESADMVPDEEQLIEKILNLTVRAPMGEEWTLGYVLIGKDGIRSANAESLEMQAFEQLGCCLHSMDGETYIAIHGGKVADRLKLESKAVAQILSRLPGAIKSFRMKVFGTTRQRFTLVKVNPSKSETPF